MHGPNCSKGSWGVNVNCAQRALTLSFPLLTILPLWMKKLWMFIIAVAGMWGAPRTFSEPDLSNGIAAIVNGTVVTRQELLKFTAQQVDLLMRTYGRQPKVFQQHMDETMRDGLQQLVERRLILHEFDTSGAILPESVIDERIKEIIRIDYTDRVSLTKTLQAQGKNMDQFRQEARERIIINYMIDRNVASAVVVSPAKIERYYTNHLDRFKLGDQVKLRMIVLNSKSGKSTKDILDLGLEIQTVVGKGTSFAEMASVYSEGSERTKGGDWGWTERSQLRRGLADVAFEMKPGELSGVLGVARENIDDYLIYRYDTNATVVSARPYKGSEPGGEERKFGAASSVPLDLPQPQEFYLMAVEDKRVARTRALDEVREEIENDLKIEERARLQKKWVERLKEKSFVRYFN